MFFCKASAGETAGAFFVLSEVLKGEADKGGNEGHCRQRSKEYGCQDSHRRRYT